MLSCDHAWCVCTGPPWRCRDDAQFFGLDSHELHSHELCQRACKAGARARIVGAWATGEGQQVGQRRPRGSQTTPQSCSTSTHRQTWRGQQAGRGRAQHRNTRCESCYFRRVSPSMLSPSTLSPSMYHLLHYHLLCITFYMSPSTRSPSMLSPSTLSPSTLSPSTCHLLCYHLPCYACT